VAAGLKLLGCGYSGETAVIRVLFLADTLARRSTSFARVFELAVADVERQET